jgi:hypothetical protein
MLFFLVFVAALVLQMLLPWWSMAVAALVICSFKAKSAGHAFRHSFAAIFLLWGAVALYQTLSNKNILAKRVGEMFMLASENNWILLVLITALIGGLAAAVSGLAGYYIRMALNERNKQRAV